MSFLSVLGNIGKVGLGALGGPVGLAITGGGLLASHFLGNHGKSDDGNPEDPYTNALVSNSKDLRTQAGNLSGQGQEALNPVIDYLKNVLSDNPSAILDATRQQRGRVIDQYDTARKTIANFQPRGGGSTSAAAESQFREGEDLANVTSTARNQAVTQAGALGSNLTGLGLSAEQLASADLNEVIQSVLTRAGFDVQKRGQNMEALGGLGEALGTIIASKVGAGGK